MAKKTRPKRMTTDDWQLVELMKIVLADQPLELAAELQRICAGKVPDCPVGLHPRGHHLFICSDVDERAGHR